MPVGEREAETQKDSEAPPLPPNPIRLRIPVEMIVEALARSRRRDPHEPCSEPKPKIRFSVPLFRCAIPLNPLRPLSPEAPDSDEEKIAKQRGIELLSHASGAMNVTTRRRQPRVQGELKMPTFTIDVENNITCFGSGEEAKTAGHSGSGMFDSQAALAEISAEWPLSRFVDIWNSIPGQMEVRRFAGRDKAVARIWSAIQPLARNSEASQSKPVRRNKAARKANKKAHTVHKHSAAKKSAGRRSGPGNKKAGVIAMMKRARGATLSQIMAATGWQAHTVRGMISILGSKGGLKVESSKGAGGERTYRITR